MLHKRYSNIYFALFKIIHNYEVGILNKKL